jgi:hypothetical protein
MVHGGYRVSFTDTGLAHSVVVFDASSGTPVISRAANATLTDDGTGLFTVNFAAPFSSAHYVLAGNGRTSDTSGDIAGQVLYRRGTSAAKTASTCQIQTTRWVSPASLAVNNLPEICCAFYGAQ